MEEDHDRVRCGGCTGEYEACFNCVWRRDDRRGGGDVRGGGLVRLEGPGWVSYKGVIREVRAEATKLLSVVLNEIRPTFWCTFMTQCNSVD